MDRKSTQNPNNPQAFRQHWRCPSCGEKGSVVGEEDILQLIHRTLNAHYAQNPDCIHPEAVQLYAPDFAAKPPPIDGYDPNEPMHTVGVTSVTFCAWSPGDVHNGDPFTQVHILLTVPALQSHLLVRLKTEEACEEWIDNLMKFSDEVFPKGGS